MALFDDIVKGGNLWTGLAIGAGADAPPMASSPRILKNRQAPSDAEARL
jgi:hypothetical protein